MAKALTESEWREVFRIRCNSKAGRGVSKEEMKLISRAITADRERYASLDADVFDATVPFGSTRRYPRKV